MLHLWETLVKPILCKFIIILPRGIPVPPLSHSYTLRYYTFLYFTDISEKLIFVHQMSSSFLNYYYKGKPMYEFYSRITPNNCHGSVDTIQLRFKVHGVATSAKNVWNQIWRGLKYANALYTTSTTVLCKTHSMA